VGGGHIIRRVKVLERIQPGVARSYQEDKKALIIMKHCRRTSESFYY